MLMLFDCAALLEPVSNTVPFGQALGDTALYDDFKALSNASQRTDWGRQLNNALSLAQQSRDLRAWVWLTRSSICAGGIPGLASGLQLIAEGLERYWEELPPQHANEKDPVERYMMRLSALTQLGATHYACNLDDLMRFGRHYTDLQADLNDVFARAERDQATLSASGQARDATGRICLAFERGFGPSFDPMVNFDILNLRLDEIGTSGQTSAKPDQPIISVAEPVPIAPAILPGVTRSRDDVIRTLDQILAYYEAKEPSSPVPLLLTRAKRLVPLTFMEALKDLAPAGLSELLAVAGQSEQRD